MKTEKIAEKLGLRLTGSPSMEIDSVGNLDSADRNQATYLESEKHIQRAESSHAGCLIVPEGVELKGKTTLPSPHPKYHFARLTAILHPPVLPEPGIHATAIISDSASLAPNVRVGPYAVIEDEVILGNRTCISAFVHVAKGSKLGDDVFLHPRVTIYSNVNIGSRVTIHAGTVVGSDGFGYVFHEGEYTKFPQVGGVLIDDDVEIGSNVAIDRGALGQTHIFHGTKIDNLVQVAHNVVIGEHCVIAAQTGISGSSVIERFAVIGGQVGIADHVRVQERARVGAQAGAPTGKVIRKGDYVWGTPARPMEVFKAQYRGLSRLPRMRRELAELKQRVAECEEFIKKANG